MPSTPLVTTCLVVRLSCVLGVISVGDPLFSLSAMGARPVVVVLTISCFMVAELANSRRL